MTAIDGRYIIASNVSTGWLNTVRALHATPSRKVVHLVVRILDPTTEVDEIRVEAQGLIDQYNATHSKQLYDIETTRNTVFPAAWARRHPEPSELASYYRARYTKDALRGFRNNARGTYFGRIVAYPRGDDRAPGDQLTDTVRKLRAEKKGGAPKSSRYEINIYNEAFDTSPMSFPCLAHLSVHLHEARLHMQAIYRNETMVGRAYGNYLGLAELQAYMAKAADLGVGELLMTVGHAELDGNKTPVTAMLARRDGVENPLAR